MTRKITRIIAFLTAAIMMVCVLPVSTNTAIAGKDDSGSIQLTGIKSFTDGVFTYTLANDQTATVTGFSSQYTGSGEELTVGSSASFNGSTYPVTAVAANAFRNENNLNITFDGDIHLEGRFSNDSDYDGAFANCNHLTLTFKGQHVSLGPSTFQNCDELTVRDEYSGDNGSFAAGQKAFAFVKNLKLTTSADVKVSGTSYNVFQGASGEMTFLGGVTNIGGYSFYGCSEGLTVTTTLNDTYNWNDSGIGNVDIIINATAENYNKAWPYSGKPKSLTIHCADYIAEISNAGSYGGYWNYQVFMNFNGGIGTIHSNAFAGFRGKNGSVIYIEDNDHHSTTVEENCFPISSDLTVRFNMKKSSIDGWAILDKYSYTHFEYLAVDTIPDYRESGKQQMLLSALLNALQVKHPETGDKLTVDEVKSVSFPATYPTTVQQVSGLILYNRSTDAELRTGTDAGEKNFLLTRDSNFTNLTELTLTLNDENNTIVEVNKVYNYTAHTNPFLLSDLFRETGYTYSGSMGEVSWNGNAFTVNKNAYWDEQTKTYTDADIYFTNDSPGTVSRLLMLKDSKAIGIFMITQGDDVVFDAAEDDDGIFTIQLGTGGQSAIITGLADGYNGDGNIVIPATIQYQGHAVRVTEIAGEAFDENESRLKSITFDNGDSPIELGYTAFWGCPNLTEVSGTGLVSIHPNGFAFYRNPSLHSISLRIKEDSPKDYIIYGNGNLTDITLDSDGTMDTVSGKLFFNEPALETLTFLCPVGTLAQGAFKERTIRHLAFNGGIQTIAKEALRNCTTLESFTAGVLPEDGTTTIGDDAFIGCTSLTNVEIASPITSFGYECFENVPATSLSFRTSNATIQHFAFAVMPNIKTLVFDGTVKDAEYYAFGYYYDNAGTPLETLIFKGYVTNISSWAYCGNYLKALVFAEGVGSIGSNAFVSNPNASGGGGAFSSNSHLVYIGKSSQTTIRDWAFPNQKTNIYCNMPGSAVSISDSYSNVKYTGDESPDIYLDPTFSGAQYGGFYGTSDVPYHTYAQALDFDIDSAEKQFSNFRKDCTSAGITMDLPYDGSLSSSTGYILHIRPDENGEISIPAGTFEGRSKLGGIVIENGNSRDSQKQTNCLTIGKEALAGCTGLTFITFENESCTVNIGVDGLRGCSKLTSNLKSTQTSHVESDAGVVTFSNQETGLGLQLKAKEVSPAVNETALIQQAVSEKIFTEGEQNKVHVWFIDLSLVSPTGNAVNVPAEVNLIRKLGQMTGSDSVKVSKIALYHIENNVPVYVEAQYDQESEPGKIQIVFKADGFSPYVLAYTIAGDIGEDGDFTYLLSDDGTATITGYGNGFSGDTINIPETTEIGGRIYQVTGIAAGALQNSPATIHKIQFNNTQNLSIAENAFSGMADVTEIAFEGTGNVIFTDGTAFNGSGTGIVAVTMPNGLTAGTGDGLCGGVFSGITDGYKLTVDNISSIPENMFKNDTKLTEMTILSALKNISKFKPSWVNSSRRNFKDCAIGTSAFEGAENLTSFTVAGSTGESIAIGNEAFMNCTSLTELNIADKISGLGENGLSNTGFTELTLYTDNAELGKEALAYNPKLEKLEIIGGVYGTGSRFLGGTGTNATKLRQLIFDGTVNPQLYDGDIRGERLSVLVFKNGGSRGITEKAIYTEEPIEAQHLTVYVDGEFDDNPYIKYDGFPEDQQVRIYLNFPTTSEEAHQTNNLIGKANIADVVYAMDGAPTDFYLDTSLKEDSAVSFNSLERIKEAADQTYDYASKFRAYFREAGYDPSDLEFRDGEYKVSNYKLHVIGATDRVGNELAGDERLTEVEIKLNSGRSIVFDDGAFKDCINLSDLTFTAVRNADIGKNAFENCTKLSQVKAYNKYDFTFREESFKGCSALHSLYIYGLDNVNIYADAFAGTAITELNIRYNYVGVMIGDNAFRGMTGLESVVIDNKNSSNKISIGENAFADCGELKEVSLKKSDAPTIAANAFSGTTIETLRIDGGSTNVAEGAAAGGKTYIDGGKTFNANLARKIGNFETIILTNPQTISKDAQVFAGNENLKIVYLGKDSGISGIGGAIFDGMPETAAAFVAHKQTDFTSDTKPEREDGELHFLDNVTVKYIDGTNNKANPDGSENNGFRTFAQAKAYTEKIAEQNEQKRTSGSDTYYYTEAAKILRKALTAAGVSFTENDIRFPLATEEADSAVFYVIGTVNIRDNETWESPEGSTMMLLRNEGFTAPMVSINSGKSLSLSNVVLDGVNIPAAAPLIQGTTGATLNINEGAVICNNNRTTFNSYPNYAGGIYISGTVNMTGGTISGNRGTYGGGIQVCGSSTSFFMSGGVIEENVAFDNWSRYGQCSYGGGVNVGSGAKMYMSGGEIRNNQAIDGYNQLGADGGGIAIGCDVSGMCQQAKLYMTGGTISGNYAEHDGGGIYIQDNCEGHFTGGLIEGNTANTGVFGGGGIYVNGKRDVKDGIAYLEYVLITGNSAKEEGGGLAGCSTSTSTVYAINGGAIYGNHSGDGSDIYTDTIQRSAFPSLRMTGMISSVMFNGAPYNWTDSRTGEKLTAAQLSRINNVLHDSMVTLTANPDGSQPTGAPMIIRNNVSNTKGGGIGSNGSVIIGGTPESQEVTWKPSASKILWNRNMKEGETFTFKVYKENASQGKNYWWTVYEDEAVGQGTVTGGRDGQPKAISFDTINLGEMYAKDIGKTFTYLVAEVDPHDENMIVPGTYLAYTVAIVTEWDDKNKKETLGTDILRIEKGTILADGSFEFDNEFDGEIVEEAVNNNNFGRIRTEVTAADTVFHNYSTKTELSASKQWLRYNGSSMPPDGAKVMFELYADGMATGKTIELDGRADPSGEFAAWTATWKDLDVYRRNADGLFERNEDGGYIRIEYAVKEISVTPADRFSVIEELIPTAVNAPAVFLNKETGSFTERTVRKEWDDDGNRDGMRPTSIVTTLTADGAFVQQVTLSDANGWAATVRDLPVNKDGKAITYAWTEQEVSGYTQEEVETTGTVTVFTNRVIRVIVELPPEEPQPEVVQLPKNGRWIPGMIFDDYLTPLGGEWLINHVGDCFD